MCHTAKPAAEWVRLTQEGVARRAADGLLAVRAVEHQALLGELLDLVPTTRYDINM